MMLILRMIISVINNYNNASKDAVSHMRPNQRVQKYRDSHQVAKFGPMLQKMETICEDLNNKCTHQKRRALSNQPSW